MAATPGSARLHAIDAIRAAAIVAVVFTHSGAMSFRGVGRSVWDFPLTSAWVRFHVPSFLLVSGFLYARSHPIAVRQITRRLARLLVPYLVATLVAFASLKRPSSLADAAFRLATASTFGMFYYIFILACCIPLTWVFSRIGRSWMVAIWLLLLGLALLEATGVLLRFGVPFFWMVRLPVYRFNLGYFVSGWLAALLLPELIRWAKPRARLLGALSLLGVVVGIASFAGWIPSPLLPARMFYTLAVVTLIAVWNRNRPVSAGVRLLSEVSLMIYLYHPVFQQLAFPITDAMPDLLRILGQAAIGVFGCLLLAVLARRVLGDEQARRWLGA